jgi:hypothetical protein
VPFSLVGGGLLIAYFRTECADAPEEEKAVSTESFNKLSCHISSGKAVLLSFIIDEN